MKNLYEVAVEGAELERMLEESDGELTPELEQRFDAFLAGGKDKINAALCVRRNLEAEMEMCRKEAARLAARAASVERNRARLSERILAAVDFGFGGKVKTAQFTAYGQTSGEGHEYTLAPDCDILALHKTSPDLVRMQVELNKAALNAALKDGEAIPREIHVEAVPGKRFLQVR